MEEFLERIARIQQCVNGDGTRNLRNILKTCKELLHDRGFEGLVEYGLEEDNGGTGLVLSGENAQGGKLRVHMCMEDRVGVKFARAVLESSNTEGNCSSIIISIDGPTPFTRKECNTVQFFTAIELCKNLTHHCLVPRHQTVTASELPNGIRVGSLPRILDTDRVVQYYNWPCGTIVKIKRVFGGYEPIDYFRVVAPACGG